MAEASIQVSSEFLYARIHGLWAGAFQGEALQTLAHAASLDQLERLLQEHGLHNVQEYGDFGKSLQLRELTILNGIRKKLPDAIARFYRAFMYRMFYRNLKTLLHYRFFRENEAEIEALIIPLPFGHPLDLPRLFNADSTEQFLDILRPEENKNAIADCLGRMARTKDILRAESDLEKLSYTGLLDAALALPSDLRDQAAALVQEEIDIQNLSTLLRNIRTYHFSAERMMPLWLDGSRALPPSRLTELSARQTAQDIIQELPAAMSAILSPLAGGDIHRMETALWKLSYSHARSLFLKTDSFWQSAVAFAFLQHFETQNISRVYEGFHFGAQPQDIQDMLVS